MSSKSTGTIMPPRFGLSILMRKLNKKEVLLFTGEAQLFVLFIGQVIVEGGFGPGKFRAQVGSMLELRKQFFADSSQVNHVGGATPDNMGQLFGRGITFESNFVSFPVQAYYKIAKRVEFEPAAARRLHFNRRFTAEM